MDNTTMDNSISALDALDRLKQGNINFIANQRSQKTTLVCTETRAKLANKQEPFAIILGCSDSRVPAEFVFDQGLGDLFVIRVAGNIVAPSQIGSVEFAVSQFGVQLVVVLGHSNCGAIRATIDVLTTSIDKQRKQMSKGISSIVNRIKPSITPLLNAQHFTEHHHLIHASVIANVNTSVNRLKHGSSLLKSFIAEGKLLIVGAEYSLDTGVVKFFDS